MKTIIKNSIIAIGCFLLLTATGCRKERAGTGSMVVRMTDAPAAFAKINVYVKEVQIHYADETKGSQGWVMLASNSGIYNLLDLQNDVTVILSDEKSIPLGAVTQLRLILGDQNTIVTLDGIVSNLEMSSEAKTGVKINLNVNIDFKQHIDILLDFDGEKSVVVEGDGSFKLKPVIQIKSIVQS